MQIPVAVIFLAVFLNGCCSTSEKNENAGAITDLRLIHNVKGDEFDDRFRELYYIGTPLMLHDFSVMSNTDEEFEKLLKSECGVKDGSIPKGGGLDLVLKPIIKFVVDKLDRAIQAELEEYSVAYTATTRDKFYRFDNSTSLALNAGCFRAFRYLPGETTRSAVDFVGQIKLSPGGQVQVRPLRLMFVAPYYEKARDRLDSQDVVQVTIRFSVEAVWQEHSRGRKETVIDTVLFSEALNLKEPPKGKRAWYFMEKDQQVFRDWRNYPLLPMVPVSVDLNGKTHIEDVNWTVTFAEVGPAPKFLKWIGEQIHGNKDKIGEKIVDLLDDD